MCINMFNQGDNNPFSRNAFIPSLLCKGAREELTGAVSAAENLLVRNIR